MLNNCVLLFNAYSYQLWSYSDGQLTKLRLKMLNSPLWSGKRWKIYWKWSASQHLRFRRFNVNLILTNLSLSMIPLPTCYMAHKVCIIVLCNLCHHRRFSLHVCHWRKHVRIHFLILGTCFTWSWTTTGRKFRS